MKTTARFFFSATIGLGLSAFTILSVFIAGATADSSVIAFGLLAIYGMLEIAILSYAPARFELRPAARRDAPADSGSPVYVRIPAIIEAPMCGSDRRAA